MGSDEAREILVSLFIGDLRKDGAMTNAILVSGIEASMTEAQIRDFFGSCGIIWRLELERPEHSSPGGRTKGANIVFASVAAASEALMLHGTMMGENTIQVTPFVPEVKTRNEGHRARADFQPFHRGSV